MIRQVMAESQTEEPLAELMGYHTWPREIALDFERARGVVSVKYIKNRENLKNDFPSVVADFRALEIEYLKRIGDHPENAQQVRRIITEMLLQAASDTDQPFETCQQYWHELQQLGFYRIERECTDSWMFADICCEHGRIDIGLGVLDPLIQQLEILQSRPNLTEWAAEYYKQRLGDMRNLRARLEAARG